MVDGVVLTVAAYGAGAGLEVSSSRSAHVCPASPEAGERSRCGPSRWAMTMAVQSAAWWMPSGFGAGAPGNNCQELWVR